MKIWARRKERSDLPDFKTKWFFLIAPGVAFLTLSFAGSNPDLVGPQEKGICCGKQEAGKAIPITSQLKKNGELTLTLVTAPSPAVVGQENRLQLIVTDAVGRPIENAKVRFSYTTPARDRKPVEAAGAFRNGQYEAPARFEKADDWSVTVSVIPPGKREVRETFSVEVIGPKRRK